MLKVGNQSEESTPFNFELAKNEIPITLFSGLDKADDGKLALTSIGLEIKQK